MFIRSNTNNRDRMALKLRLQEQYVANMIKTGRIGDSAEFIRECMCSRLDTVDKDLNKYIDCIEHGFTTEATRKNFTFRVLSYRPYTTNDGCDQRFGVSILVGVTQTTPLGETYNEISTGIWFNRFKYKGRSIETLNIDKFKIKMYISEFAPLVIK